VSVNEQCPTCGRNNVILIAESNARDLLNYIDKLTAQLNIAKQLNDTYKEQYLQQHENTLILADALRKNASGVFHEIRENLHKHTSELDKVVSKATYWKHRYEVLESQCEETK
jgi:hypothetical protein